MYMYTCPCLTTALTAALSHEERERLVAALARHSISLRPGLPAVPNGLKGALHHTPPKHAEMVKERRQKFIISRV